MACLTQVSHEAQVLAVQVVAAVGVDDLHATVCVATIQRHYCLHDRGAVDTGAFMPVQHPPGNPAALRSSQRSAPKSRCTQTRLQ